MPENLCYEAHNHFVPPWSGYKILQTDLAALQPFYNQFMPFHLQSVTCRVKDKLICEASGFFIRPICLGGVADEMPIKHSVHHKPLWHILSWWVGVLIAQFNHLIQLLC